MPAASVKNPRETFARLILGLDALAFLGFGLAFLIAPVPLLERLEISLHGPIATIEARAMYGGLELGIGGFLLWCLRGHTREGVMAAALALAGLALVRVSTMIAHQTATQTLVVLAALEIAGAVASGFAYQLSRQDR